MTSTSTSSVWPHLAYRDVTAAVAFLHDAFGFVNTAMHTADGDDAVVKHAEMRLPEGGGIMIATVGRDDSAFGRRVPGNDSVYVACDDPDAVFERAVAAGAVVVQEPIDEKHGWRGFTVRDPEGTLWSFGTHQGARDDDFGVEHPA
ncbi:MAG: VOC family protein [Acidimicrobiia bacterium]